MARHKKTEREQAQEFGLLLPVVLALLAGLAWWKQNPTLALRLLIAGPVVCFVALAVPRVWLRLFRLWMKLAAGLSWLMTRILLTIFFFLILTPFSLVMRVLGKAPLDLAWKDGKSSYWIDKDPIEPAIERYEKQF